MDGRLFGNEQGLEPPERAHRPISTLSEQSGAGERHGVGDIPDLAKNPRLETLAEPWLADANAGFTETSEQQRRFGEFRYAAKTWSSERRVITRVEHDRLGTNRRYIVANLVGASQALCKDLFCKDLYCVRGDVENRIKEQFELFADRTSCHSGGQTSSACSAISASSIMPMRWDRTPLNLELSVGRAAAVRDALVAAGIPSSIIEIAYHEANNPLIPMPRGVPELRNRRVEVTIR